MARAGFLGLEFVELEFQGSNTSNMLGYLMMKLVWQLPSESYQHMLSLHVEVQIEGETRRCSTVYYSTIDCNSTMELLKRSRHLPLLH
jgi:hypothetical protein